MFINVQEACFRDFSMCRMVLSKVTWVSSVYSHLHLKNEFSYYFVCVGSCSVYIHHVSQVSGQVVRAIL